MYYLNKYVLSRCKKCGGIFEIICEYSGKLVYRCNKCGDKFIKTTN